MLMDVCNGDKAQAQKTSVAIGQNAFCFAIRGFKMRLPNGYTMVERNTIVQILAGQDERRT